MSIYTKDIYKIYAHIDCLDDYTLEMVKNNIKKTENDYYNYKLNERIIIYPDSDINIEKLEELCKKCKGTKELYRNKLCYRCCSILLKNKLV